MKLSQALIGFAVLAATVGIAWGAMAMRVSVAEAAIDRQGVQIERHERELRQGDTRAERIEWMLLRVCEKMNAQPCAMPGSK